MQSPHRETHDDYGYDTLLPPDLSNIKISAAPPHNQTDYGYDDPPLQDIQLRMDRVMPRVNFEIDAAVLPTGKKPQPASGEALPEAEDFGINGRPLPGDTGHSGDVSSCLSTSS
jgi:hypothetical protein